VDLVVACGDLPFEYLAHLVDGLDVPLVFVPGNHDPDIEGAYVDALTAACRALEVTPPRGTGDGPSGRIAAIELARVEGELRQRGLAVDLSEAR
jgi:hypothetical protein